jgi:hypothetical protein
MQRRLLIFFGAVRTQSPQLNWTFLIQTTANENWTEAMLAKHGMPPNWVSSISAEAQHPFQGKLASGFLTAQRCVFPRKAVRNIFRESRSLVTDVMTEFSGRLPNYR